MTVRTTSFEDIRAVGQELRDLLASHGVTLHPNSILSQALANVDEAIQYWKAQVLPTDRRGERLVADLAAVQALGSAVDTIKRAGAIPGMVERLRALAGGDPRLTSTGEQSGDRDAIFELLCWHVCMQFADDVAFAEPDIRCTYRGHQFGIACKAHYGRTARAVKAIRKGWRQITSSPVEYGIVMLHLTNHFPHERMYQPASAGRIWAPGDEATLNTFFETNLRDASRPIEKEFLEHLRRNPKPPDGRFHGTLYAAHTLAPSQEMRFRVGGMVYQGMHRNPAQDVWDFVKNLNAFWQDLSASGTTAL